MGDVPVPAQRLQLQRLPDAHRGADGVSGLRRARKRCARPGRGPRRFGLRILTLNPLDKLVVANVRGLRRNGSNYACSDELPSVRTAATLRSSRTNWRIASLRSASSSMRRSEEGCTVAMTYGARFERMKLPRSRVTRKLAPSSAWAAVAPSRTMTSGRTTSSSASSHGRHALISIEEGLLWMRRLPRGTHLKCLTTLVT